MKNIVVATTNVGKLDACFRAFDHHAEANPGFEYTILPVSVESGVSDTPLSDDQGTLGCEKRLAAAQQALPDQDLYVALEGVISQVSDRWFVRGWTMINDPLSKRSAVASGAAVEVPALLTKRISSMDQFSDIVAQVYAVTTDEKAEVRNIGANGVFSNGEYTRRDSFYDGIRICLAYLTNERNW